MMLSVQVIRSVVRPGLARVKLVGTRPCSDFVLPLKSIFGWYWLSLLV